VITCPHPAIAPRQTLPKESGPVLAEGSALSGRSISLSPGHGKRWTGTYYDFERPVYCAPLNREDDHNLEGMIYLNQYLTQDGAVTKVYRCLDKSYGTHAGSGEPWWRVSAGYWVKQNGYPCSVYASSTGECSLQAAGVSASDDSLRSRGLASNYDDTDIYVSLHSNGYTGNCEVATCPNGTATYYDGVTAEHADWRPSVRPSRLTSIMQSSTRFVIGMGYDLEGSWSDQPELCGDAHSSTAAALIELAFHDSCDRDGAYLQDNFFRSTTMWATYKGSAITSA